MWETYSGPRMAVFLGGLAVIGLLEALAPERQPKRPKWKRWGFHGLLAVINVVIVRVALAAPLLYVASQVHARGWGLMPLLGLSGWPALILSVVLLDGLNYHWHRINHEWRFLWRFHKMHHEDDEMDVTTTLRFHPGELVLSSFVKAAWITIVGPSAAAFAVFEAGISLFAQFHHGNLSLPARADRALRIFVPSPRYHAAHHTKTPRSRDGNYATILSVWDRLCGTYHVPEEENLTDLGIPEGGPVLSWKWWWIGPFR